MVVRSVERSAAGGGMKLQQNRTWAFHGSKARVAAKCFAAPACNCTPTWKESPVDSISTSTN